MFIIKMKHVGKDGTYTTEEQSATDEFWRDQKYKRTIERWLGILCPHFNRDYFNAQLRNNRATEFIDAMKEYELAIDFIIYHLEVLNKQDDGKRSFCIDVIEVNELC